MRLFLVFSVFCAVFCSQISAKILSYDELNSAPDGLAKDYYIYRLISEKNPSKEQMKSLQRQVYQYSGKIKDKLDRLVGIYVKKLDTCKEPIESMSRVCQRAVLSIAYLSKLSTQRRDELAEFFKNEDAEIYGFISNFGKTNAAQIAIWEINVFAFFKYYSVASDKNAFLNSLKFTSDFITKASSERKFVNIISDAVILKKYGDLRSNLLAISASAARGEVAFLLGINAINFGIDALALEHFKTAANSANSSYGRDKANFWVYLISKDKNLLNKLANSGDINIYSLYAIERNGSKKIRVVSPRINNQKILANYDTTDPFSWQRVKEKAAKLSKPELVEFASEFRTAQTLGEYCYIMERAHDYKVAYFPMPFMEFIGSSDISRQALILALARQESRFIQSAISSSYALGMMQFMPFLANDIGKKKLAISGFDQDDMFKPQIAYKFANYHLDDLEKFLKSPIFIAYAYNGGIGFTKRMLQKGELFSQNSPRAKYEPFLSMELVPYAESREYAKKVLANYVIYLSLLHSNTKISLFFENLTKPGVLEKFR